MLGPNGAGKSTFIKAALGLLEPQKGRITIGGLDPREETVLLRDRIGYMPESECLIKNSSAVELVSYMAQLSGLYPEEAIKRSHAILDFVGLKEERYREIETYSTGMRQRVKLAQSIVHDPSVLFLDEPTSGMDPGAKEKMLSLIDNLGDSDKTILICSHLLHEVEQVSDHVMIINEGRLLKSGTMQEVLKEGENRYSIEVKGTPGGVDEFKKDLGEYCEILSSERSGEKTVLKVDGVCDAKRCFSLAEKHGIQIRSYTPDKASLEDFFIETFDGGEERCRLRK